MNYLGILIGNLCTLLAMGINAFSSTRKTTKGMLRAQNLSQVVYFSGAIALGGYSAATQNVVSFLRNMAAIRNIRGKWLEWSFAALGLMLGVVFNNHGIIGLLPVLGNLQYTLCIFRFSDRERLLKISFLISTFSFVLLNAVLWNIVGVIADLTVCITTAIVLFKGKTKE
jgi:hypothetical protein